MSDENRINGDDRRKNPEFRVPPKTWVVWTAIVAGIVMLILFNHRMTSQPSFLIPSEFQKKMDAVPCQIARAQLNYNPQSPLLGEVVGTYYSTDDKGGIVKDKEVPFRTQVLLTEKIQDKLQSLPHFEFHEPNTMWMSILVTLLPFALIALFVWFFFIRQIKMAGKGALSFGKSKARLLAKERNKTTFKDVAGIDEAIEEVSELVEFLKDPKKFQRLGGRIPKGVLMVGPPGTGKTLLAKAIAGEADAAFFSISGSDFVEMFVGVGASRVRDMFEQARKNTPCLIFIDEIDAVGRHRGAGIGGGNDEREQTLNQLLVEMDGFDVKTNVILIAATNRPDVLDPALLRPGRFDRQISVDAPDLIGRDQILQVHAKGKPMATGVDLKAVAKKTPGYTGADLANVLNEAALLTARSNANLIDDRALDEAIDRVMAGPQKRSRVMKEHERKVTAYHEGGHALVAAALRNSAPVTKITILPRGRALGYTMVVPENDKYSITRNELLDQMAYAMGGRVAEELVFHDPSTGASNDIEKATGIARKMVTEFGMSERVGSVRLGQGGGEPFLGRDAGHERNYSDQIAYIVDEEVRRLIDGAHDEAYAILTENRDVLDELALELLERETLNQAEIAQVFTNIRKRDFRDVWLSKETRTLQSAGPVESRREKAEREAQEEATQARLEEPLDAQPPHAQGVGGQESFQGGATDIGTDGHPG